MGRRPYLSDKRPMMGVEVTGNQIEQRASRFENRTSRTFSSRCTDNRDDDSVAEHVHEAIRSDNQNVLIFYHIVL